MSSAKYVRHLWGSFKVIFLLLNSLLVKVENSWIEGSVDIQIWPFFYMFKWCVQNFMMTPPIPGQGELTPRLEKSKQEQRPILEPHSRVAQGNTGVLEPHNGKLGCAALHSTLAEKTQGKWRHLSPTTHPCPRDTCHSRGEPWWAHHSQELSLCY